MKEDWARGDHNWWIQESLFALHSYLLPSSIHRVDPLFCIVWIKKQISHKGEWSDLSQWNCVLCSICDYFIDHSYNWFIRIKDGVTSNWACSEQLVTALKTRHNSEPRWECVQRDEPYTNHKYFLLFYIWSWYMVLEITTECSETFYLRQTIIPKYYCVARISANTLCWNSKY